MSPQTTTDDVTPNPRIPASDGRRTATTVLASIMLQMLRICDEHNITYNEWDDRAPGVYDKVGGDQSQLLILESLLDEHSRATDTTSDAVMDRAWTLATEMFRKEKEQ